MVERGFLTIYTTREEQTSPPKQGLKEVLDFANQMQGFESLVEPLTARDSTHGAHSFPDYF